MTKIRSRVFSVEVPPLGHAGVAQPCDDEGTSAAISSGTQVLPDVPQGPSWCCNVPGCESRFHSRKQLLNHLRFAHHQRKLSAALAPTNIWICCKAVFRDRWRAGRHLETAMLK
eukprot:914055-Pyramimonas_sp.AAC.1